MREPPPRLWGGGASGAGLVELFEVRGQEVRGRRAAAGARRVFRSLGVFADPPREPTPHVMARAPCVLGTEHVFIWTSLFCPSLTSLICRATRVCRPHRRAQKLAQVVKQFRSVRKLSHGGNSVPPLVDAPPGRGDPPPPFRMRFDISPLEKGSLDMERSCMRVFGGGGRNSVSSVYLFHTWRFGECGGHGAFSISMTP